MPRVDPPEQSLFQFPEEATHRSFGVVIGALVQALVIGMLILIPILYVNTLPAPTMVSVVALPMPPAPRLSPPPPAPAARMKIHKVQPRIFNPKALTAPVTIPKQIPIVEDSLPAVAESSPAFNGVPGGLPGGLGTEVTGIPTALPPPTPSAPAPAAESATAPDRILVGGQVQAALLVHEVPPHYPSLAKRAHVSGTVELKAVIGRDGKVEDLTAVSGQPLLVGAAIDAVKQWIYKPTILNGKPVEVATEIAVHFELTS